MPPEESAKPAEPAPSAPRRPHSLWVRAAVHTALCLAVGALWLLLGFVWMRRQLHNWLLRRLLKKRGLHAPPESPPLALPRR